MVRINKTVPIPVKSIDSSKPPEYIDDRGSPDCKNIIINRNTIEKRPGTDSLGATLGERVLGYAELLLTAAARVVRVGPTKIELLNQSTSAWADIAGVALTAAATARVDFAQPILTNARILTFTNFADNIRKYTGTGNTADLGGSPPKCKFMIEFNSYLVIAYVLDGGDTLPVRIQWSDTNDPETWSGGNASHWDLQEDGKDITGLGTYANYLTVHKESGIWLGFPVTSSDVFNFEKRPTGVGALNFSTIKNIPSGDQMFLARDGIHQFNGTSAPLVAQGISDEIRQGINPEHLGKIWALVANEFDEYWVGIPMGSQTEADTIFKYNYKTGQSYKDERSNISAIGTYSRTTQKTWDDMTISIQSATTKWDDIQYQSLYPAILIGDSSGISTVKEIVSNDNGVAIEAWWNSKKFLDENPNILSRWQEIEVVAKGNSVDLYYSIDDGASWVFIKRLVLTADYPLATSPLMGYFDVLSRGIQFRFFNNILGETFTLKQFTVRYVPHEAIK